MSSPSLVFNYDLIYDSYTCTFNSSLSKAWITVFDDVTNLVTHRVCDTNW